jgi:Transglutaminase-like superfamily
VFHSDAEKLPENLMRNERSMSAGRAALPSSEGNLASQEFPAHWISAKQEEHHRIFRLTWLSVNLLLVAAIIVAIYSAIWEYSTRKYLKGFSDAIIPAAAPPEQKIQAILDWMAKGPARAEAGPSADRPDRDPSDTLNYNSLLQVCGTATNAFINLADSSDLAARRLLLLDANRAAKHVDAEVFVNGRWIVVDPVFRTILRGADGGLLTRDDLAHPAIFRVATQKISKYDPDYTFERTSHVRLARLPVVGAPMRGALDFFLPGWEDSMMVSLLLERESLATMVAMIVAVLLLALLRVSLRWYGEKRLGIQSVRVRTQLRRACLAFLDTKS